MILGAMVAAGVDPLVLRERLFLLGVQGFSVEFDTVDRSGLSATYARVQTAHEHSHRHLAEILNKNIYPSSRSRSSRAQ